MSIADLSNKTDTICLKAYKGKRISKKDIVCLLSLKRSKDIAKLFKTARDIRTIHFKNNIFLYGFVYIDTNCRNNCRFCLYRNSNKNIERYKKSEKQIIEAADNLAGSGVHLIDLTMGEKSYSSDRFLDDNHNSLCRIVSKIKKKTNLPIMVSPGIVPDLLLEKLKKAGADWYACYQETHNLNLFHYLRKQQSYSQRLKKKIKAFDQGLLIEEGILCGIGEEPEDIADSIEEMHKINADQIRVMSFVPQQNTPMAQMPCADTLHELIIIAVLRLMFPDRLIPASLDIEGIKGLQKRLDAGANVVTSVVSTGRGFAGVAQHSLDIEDSKRSKKSVEKILNKCDLQFAANAEYQDWIKNRKEKHCHRAKL